MVRVSCLSSAFGTDTVTHGVFAVTLGSVTVVMATAGVVMVTPLTELTVFLASRWFRDDVGTDDKIDVDGDDIADAIC